MDSAHRALHERLATAYAIYIGALTNTFRESIILAVLKAA
jgi:hypothetical protein